METIPIIAEVGWRFFGALVARVLDKRVAKLAVLVPALVTILSSSSEAAGTLNLSTSASTINTDPQLMEDVMSLFVNRQIHRGLVRYTSELELVNDLTESYTVSDNGKTYIFKLSESTFSDGSRITPQDVVRTFERMKKVNAAIVADLHSIIGFEKSESVKEIGVVATSRDSVKFNLKIADPFFIKNLAAVDCSILKLDNNLNFIPASSGRYTFKDLGDTFKLKLRDTKQFPSAPSDVNLVKISKDQQAIALAKSGGLDSLESYEVSMEDEKYFLSKGWKKFETQIARLVFLSLNPHKLTKEVRHQIYSALQASEGKGLPDAYIPTYGIIPPLLSGGLSQRDIKTLIQKNKKTKMRQAVELSHPEGKEFEVLADWVKSTLEKDGFVVAIKHFHIKDYFKLVHSKDYQIMMRSKYLDYPDGMAVLTYFKSNLPANTLFVGDSVSDKMIAEVQLESITAARNEQYKQIQLHLLKKFTIVPLVSGSVQSYLCSDKIKSIKAHPMGLHSVYLNEIEINQRGP